MQLRLAPAATRATWLFMLALVAIALTAAEASSLPATLVSCSTPEECCDVCGGDSLRCARGPCSSAFLTKKLFSFSMPTTTVNCWDVAFSFYSMVPYLAFVAITLELVVRTRSWSRVFCFCFIPIVSILTSSILVRALGHCTECARPCGSCIQSTGMPSGHTTNAVGFCLWLLLETAIGFGRHWSLRKKAIVTFVNVLVFAPVPYSRYYLGDHTSLQIAVGSANGVVIGLAYFLILRYVIAKRLDRASHWLANGRFPIVILNDFHHKPLANGDSSAEYALSSPVEATTTTTSNSTESLELGIVGSDQAYHLAPVTPPVGRPGAQKIVVV
ncbi:hypothetical protein Gpo141_00013989 [Globisporangium polare]